MSLTTSRHGGTERLLMRRREFYVSLVVRWSMDGSFGLIATNNLKRRGRLETRSNEGDRRDATAM